MPSLCRVEDAWYDSSMESYVACISWPDGGASIEPIPAEWAQVGTQFEQESFENDDLSLWDPFSGDMSNG